jgi:hypothetical protein
MHVCMYMTMNNNRAIHSQCIKLVRPAAVIASTSLNFTPDDVIS